MNREIHESLTDYTRWLNVNSEKTFTLYDYIHGVFQYENLHSDLAIAFLKLLWPDFMIRDEFVFLKEEFTSERYLETITAASEKAEIEYWMNLLNINETINCDSMEISLLFANKMSEMWSKKLFSEFPNKKFKVEVICEGEGSDMEIYLTFQQCN